MRRSPLAALSILALLGGPALARPVDAPLYDYVQHATNFELVGYEPLGARGMNAGLALAGRYAYVGSRTDATRPFAGILAVDLSQPAAPRVVARILPPLPAGAAPAILRAWPDGGQLVVVAPPCGALEGCLPSGSPPQTRVLVLDLRANPLDPRVLASTVLDGEAGEPFLWVDPQRPDRALFYLPTPSSPQAGLVVLDLSEARLGLLRTASLRSAGLQLRGVTVSADGTLALLSAGEAGLGLADTSGFARGDTEGELRLLTPPASFARWEGPGPARAAFQAGRPVAVAADEAGSELYGLAAVVGRPSAGCPWGVVHTVDLTQPSAPVTLAEFRAPDNQPWYCFEPDDRQQLATFSAHAPTATAHLAVVAWQAMGLRVPLLDPPSAPRDVGDFRPNPLPAVLSEDLTTTAGRSKVQMWGYPVVAGGLVHALDVRNGLYVLRYAGPRAEELADPLLLEGGSNRTR